MKIIWKLFYVPSPKFTIVYPGRRVITNLGATTPSKQSSFLMFPTFEMQNYSFYFIWQTATYPFLLIMIPFMIIYLFVCYFVKYNLHFTSKYHSISCKVDYSTWHTSVREITIPRARVPIIYILLFSPQHLMHQPYPIW